ncbi:MAG: Mfa1 family fimbria major subunit [Tannerellaceae bacterium]|nr:Mfa1 family fimbria major subunit [Tannerellaceae bacterium]
MNLKSLLATAMAVLLLVSCTKEVIKEVYVGGEDDPGTTRVTFALDANMVKTKSVDDHGNLSPTEYENLIYNYALFIFKSSGMLEATLVAKSSALDNPLTPDNNGLLTFTEAQNPGLTWDGDAIVISAGNKTFFAIVNAPKEYVDDQDSFINNKTLTLDELKNNTLLLGGELNKIVGQYGNQNDDVVYFQNPVFANGANRGFLMTSIVTPLQPDGFFKQRLDETEDNDPVVSITVSVGRAMAKVSLASDLTPADEITIKDLAQPYGALEVEGYKLINNPDEMNVAIDMSAGLLQTPYFDASSVTTSNYFISNNSSQGTDYIPVSKFDPQNDERTFTYCIENANQTPKYGNAAIATIKGYFTPLSGNLGDAKIVAPTDLETDENLNSDGDFWRIWIKPYTTSGGQALGGEYADEYFNADPTANLGDFVTAKTTTTNPKYPDLKVGDLEVYEYPKGLCYYYLPLENEENEASPYSVIRNSYYKIDIKSVSGPGYPEDPGNPGEPGGPDKPGPEVPLDAQTKIKASIKVLDWDVVNQTGNL